MTCLYLLLNRILTLNKHNPMISPNKVCTGFSLNAMSVFSILLHYWNAQLFFLVHNHIHTFYASMHCPCVLCPNSQYYLILSMKSQALQSTDNTTLLQGVSMIKPIYVYYTILVVKHLHI